MIFVDAHVHIHPNFNLTVFLNSVSDNFKKAALQNNSEENYDSVICLTESNGINFFNEFYNNKISLDEWKFHKTSEGNSLKAVSKNGNSFFIIAGRQIVTSEKLEVLALGIKEEFDDGKPADEVINFVISKNGLPVIPWGVGKWIGKRGKIIRDLLSSNLYSFLFLGDNGNRPVFWKRSPIFYFGEKNNKRNLPGSDPLPFKSEEEKPGSFGFMPDGFLDNQFPFKSLKEKIINSENVFNTYGKGESFFRFMKNQASMQIVKRNR